MRNKRPKTNGKDITLPCTPNLPFDREYVDRILRYAIETTHGVLGSIELPDGVRLEICSGSPIEMKTVPIMKKQKKLTLEQRVAQLENTFANHGELSSTTRSLHDQLAVALGPMWRAGGVARPITMLSTAHLRNIMAIPTCGSLFIRREIGIELKRRQRDLEFRRRETWWYVAGEFILSIPWRMLRSVIAFFE